ncbi:MAG: hypothetical protein ACRDNS_10325 [Trebonia sp.]
MKSVSRRRGWVATLGGISAFAVLAMAGGAPGHAVAKATAGHGRRHTVAKSHGRHATVRIAQTVAGPLLVDRAGFTVFMFTRDRRRNDRCARIRHCLTDWPAVTTTSKPVAGPGVKRSLLGTIGFHGKVREVTYAGYPLHTYKFDFGKGSTMAIGNTQFGGSWFGLTAVGKLLK